MLLKNSKATNIILQDHPAYNSKQNSNKEEEEVLEEGEINDEFYHSDE